MSIDLPDPWSGYDDGQYLYFIYCTNRNNYDEMNRLIEAGHDIDTTSDEGETAFSWCCAQNNLASAKWLVKNGANVNILLSGDPGGTPLDVAVCWASPEFRDWLRSVGGKRNQDFEEWPWPPPSMEDDDTTDDACWVPVV